MAASGLGLGLLPAVDASSGVIGVAGASPPSECALKGERLPEEYLPAAAHVSNGLERHHADSPAWLWPWLPSWRCWLALSADAASCMACSRICGRISAAVLITTINAVVQFLGSHPESC